MMTSERETPETVSAPTQGRGIPDASESRSREAADSAEHDRADTAKRAVAGDTRERANAMLTDPESSPYDFKIDLESDNTHANVIRMVGHSRRVLELGPASGYMSKVFVEHGCTVVGVELDPRLASQASRFCERVVVGDL